jgi:hypothetical protein
MASMKLSVTFLLLLSGKSQPASTSCVMPLETGSISSMYDRVAL